MSAESINWSNPGAIDDAAARRREQQAAQAAQQVEHASTKQWLETKLDEQAKPIEIFDREFLFRPIASETLEGIIELASDEASKASDVDSLDDVDPDDMSDMPALLRTMRETLGKHCLDEEMDAEAFGMLPMDELQSVFEQVSAGGELTDAQQDRVRRFRER